MPSVLLLPLLLFAAPLGLQTTPPAPPQQPVDPLGRTSPQQAIVQFLEAAHAHDYNRAMHYLDLRSYTPSDRAKSGPQLARELEDLLDDTPFDIAKLSRQPEGDQLDGLRGDLEHLDTFRVDGKMLDLQMQRVALRSDIHVWLVSAASLPQITEAHQLVAETPFEKLLPQPLVTVELFDTPVWRWIALILLAATTWFGATIICWAVFAALRRFAFSSILRSPARAALALGTFRALIRLAPPASLARLLIERTVSMFFFLALAWIGANAVDLIADRWHSRLDPRMQAMSFSILPLGRQILKLALFPVAIVGLLTAWGYNTTTILAGLGVGGLAVALAAQKTIENLFGGVSIIGDRPVLVGDTCRFGDRVGTVMHIGLRSTSLRTADRTVISVPNAEFSGMTLENLSRRDKVWFHTTISLRLETTPDQVSKVLESFRGILASNPKIEAGGMPVRFAGIGANSLNIEIAVYIATTSDDEFLAIQQDLYLRLLKAVEEAGTALAMTTDIRRSETPANK